MNSRIHLHGLWYTFSARIHLPDGLEAGGSSDIALFKGTKTPDYSIYDMTPANMELTLQPTVTFEIAYCQPLNHVSKVAAFTIGSSFGAVKLVIVIKIDYSALPGAGSSECVRVSNGKVTAYYWMMTGLEEVQSYNGDVNCVIPVSSAGQYMDDGFYYVL
ncbi:hypothetical protein AMATHDRAFT_67553 [Amanita thiersii Skay4041]|uniref:Uncharacterized protein n=1 Tax=Amanita thiersii Skay4041 TaxID=703135 RepID=A0A2A9NAC3_9AGAR|nr:hypothetical protein AMATHDRAFT_67553 [Amanita thiersii Skay4041]